MKKSWPRAVGGLALGLLLVSAPAQAVPGQSAPVTAGQKAYQTSLMRWRASAGDLSNWSRSGTVVTEGELRLDPANASAGTDPYGPGVTRHVR